MDLLLQVLAFVITILVLVSIHEAGHFVVAKALGIKVLRYAIGFGRPLLRYKGKSGTDYIIGLIPLGGYVKLLDEREVVVPEAEKVFAFNRQPLWSRALVVIAGPATNFLLAILCFWLMYMNGVEVLQPVVASVVPNSIAAQAGIQAGDHIRKVDNVATPSLQKVVLRIIERLGEKNTMAMQTVNPATQIVTNHRLNLQNWSINKLNPNPLQSLGIEPPRPPIPAVIEKVEGRGPAAKAGFLPGDRIIAINDQSIKDWYGFIEFIQKHPLANVNILFVRQGEQRETSVTIGQSYQGFNKIGHLGVQTKVVELPANMRLLRQYSPMTALEIATAETWDYFTFNFIIFKKMILGQVSLSTLGGPIAIFQTADLAFRQGLSIFLGFLGLISVMLAFLNILPIPGLDGGHLFNYLIEFIIRKPVPLKYEVMSMRIGFFILLGIMVVATFNDLLRIFLS